MKAKVCNHLFTIHHYVYTATIPAQISERRGSYTSHLLCRKLAVQRCKGGAVSPFWSIPQADYTAPCCYVHHRLYTDLSLSMKHDPPALWAQLEPVLQFLKENNPRIQKLFFISDGPTMQYRGKKNLYLLSTISFQIGFTAVNWSFLEAGHGKRVCRWHWSHHKENCFHSIPTAKALYDTLLPLTKVKLLYGEEDQMNRHMPSKRADEHQRYTEHSSSNLHYAWQDPL